MCLCLPDFYDCKKSIRIGLSMSSPAMSAVSILTKFQLYLPLSAFWISDLYTGFQTVGEIYLWIRKKYIPLIFGKEALALKITSSAEEACFSSPVILIVPLLPA